MCVYAHVWLPLCESAKCIHLPSKPYFSRFRNMMVVVWCGMMIVNRRTTREISWYHRVMFYSLCFHSSLHTLCQHNHFNAATYLPHLLTLYNWLWVSETAYMLIYDPRGSKWKKSCISSFHSMQTYNTVFRKFTIMITRHTYTQREKDVICDVLPTFHLIFSKLRKDYSHTSRMQIRQWWWWWRTTTTREKTRWIWWYVRYHGWWWWY